MQIYAWLREFAPRARSAFRYMAHINTDNGDTRSRDKEEESARLDTHEKKIRSSGYPI